MATTPSILPESPNQIIKNSMRACGYLHQYKQLKARWPGADDFLLILCRHLLDIVPDNITGTPLFHTCLINGMRATGRLINDAPICDDHSRLIHCFIDRAIDPIPRLLCLKVVCKSNHAVWNPLAITLDDWLTKHPLYEITPSDRLFVAEDAKRFKQRFRDKIVGQIVIPGQHNEYRPTPQSRPADQE